MSNVQSIICCVGDPVAGNPTQFLMQRAAAALGMDWIFVTAEVSSDKIREAFAGIRALQFSGVAFLPPHRSIGCELVDSMTEAAARSQHVRVARRDGNLWLGDDTLGAAIWELLKSAGHTADHADSNERWLIAGEPWLPHLIRLAAPPAWTGRIVEWVRIGLPYPRLLSPRSRSLRQRMSFLLPSLSRKTFPTMISPPNHLRLSSFPPRRLKN